METTDFKSLLGLERAVSVSNTEGLTDDSQLNIIEQVKDFGIDDIYFSTDDKNSYPAVFIKKVSAFDVQSLKEIAVVQQKLWNYQKVIFLYVYTDTEIHIYNCCEKPFEVTNKTDFDDEFRRIELSRAELSDRNALTKLVSLFSSIAIDSGTIWISSEAEDVRKKINFQKRVDKYLVESLKRASEKLNNLGLNNKGITHKIILRSLFLLYLEDRGATDASFYRGINPNVSSYFEVLNDVQTTYKLYAKLEKQFNGNVFSLIDGEQQIITNEHLRIIKKCFVNGFDNDGQTELFENWRLFDFKIIQIELLSEIYERFLGETDSKDKKRKGAFYTPPSLVELILDEVLPINKQYKNYNVKILDPACGSGIFLVESYKRLLKRYENAHDKKLTDFNLLKKLLTDNIYGIELNDQAIIVAAFSLYLALVDNLDPKTLWQNATLPCLVNNPEKIPENKQGYNLYCRDTISANEEIESISFDLVIGNPPFGTENKSKGVELLQSTRDYCVKEEFAKEMVLPFLHKAVKFTPNGEIALIFNTKILTNTGSTYQNFRKWLFNECYVRKIYNFSILRNAPKSFGGQLFNSAIGPICIAFYQKDEPTQKSDRIMYYAPKTFIKSNVLEGVVIDSSDVKYLPREECQKPNTKIWKIAMWGGERDFHLIKKLGNSNNRISDFIAKNNIIYGVGLQPYNKSTSKPIFDNKISQMKYICPENISRYFSNNNQTSDIKELLKDKNTINKYLEYYKVKSINDIKRIDIFRRIGATDVYSGPMLLIKEGLSDKRICASIVSEPTTFNSTVLGLKSSISNLRLLSSLINSRLATYYLLMISSSWGMERERIKPNEVYTFPLVINENNAIELENIHKEIEELGELELNKISGLEDRIEKIIISQYYLTNRDVLLIDDFINYSADLLYNKEHSLSLLPTTDTIEYINILCSELNNFLESQNLFTIGTIFKINRNAPLAMAKISFSKNQQKVLRSEIRTEDMLKEIDKHLWREKGGGIYFRKIVNYYDGSDIYIIRPNQRRFWTQSMAMEDASKLILEILNKD